MVSHSAQRRAGTRRHCQQPSRARLAVSAMMRSVAAESFGRGTGAWAGSGVR
ncbi:MAG: hypothetical protein M3444_19990 [Acidobacteriota bacterium]|nr:hypothetical protein [Acidobacteriota bacterium]MDQ5837770.1 hypothetical protein [Acidobacteriota bacterium]